MEHHIAYVLQTFGTGGIQTCLYNLASRLQDEFEFHFIATHSDYILPKFRQVAYTVALPFEKKALAAYLKEHRIDIAQTHNLREYIDAALMAKVPVVVERTDGIRNGAALKPKEGLDGVIASARGTIPEIARLIDESKIVLIYNGIDTEAIQEAAPQRFGFSQEDIIVGRTSRLGRGKNISLLIRAILELRKSYDNVRLVICGGDTTRPDADRMLDRLKAEAEPLGDSVVFTGDVEHTEGITQGYDIATCVSLPGNEGIPNSLLEAMAAAKPVVATNVDNIPELVDHGCNGLLVESNDIEQLVQALGYLIENPKARREMGQRGLMKIKAEFNLDKQAAKYGSLYHQLLGEKLSKSARDSLWSRWIAWRR